MGDRFEGPNIAVTVTSAGYRGLPWAAATAAVDGYAPHGNPPTMVEPTAHGDYPAAGRSVWKCIADGETHATTEPVWSSATPGGGADVGDTITDNTTEWELIGFTPATAIEIIGTQATANATPVYVTIATLDVGGQRRVDAIVRVFSADAATRQSFTLSADFYGAAGPTATLNGGALTDAAPRGTGTAVVELDLSSADIRLKITGVAATDLLTTYQVNLI